MPSRLELLPDSELKTLSYEKLVAIVEKKRSERIGQLERQHKMLSGALAEIEAELKFLGALEGSARASSPEEAPVRQLAGKARKPKQKRAKRGEILGPIVEVLTTAGKPMNIDQVMEALAAVGFKTSSKNPREIVRKYLLTNSAFKSGGRGLYVISKKSK